MRTTLWYARVAPLLVMLLSSGAANAGGLRCSVGEVVVENLKIGHRYSLKALANLPLALTNSGERPVGVVVDALAPGASELRQGAEAIPDAKWAKVVPETLSLRPGELAITDMVLDVPDDPALLGRKFEVLFWSHTLPDPADFVGVGIKSRVIFTVDPVRDTTDVVPAGDLGVELKSAEIDLRHLRAGREERLESLSRHPLSIRNTTTHPLTVALDVKPTTGEAREGDGDLLSVATVRLDPAVMTLAAGESRTIRGFVAVRAPKSVRGKKFLCTIAASVRDLPVRTEIQAQLSGVAP